MDPKQPPSPPIPPPPTTLLGRLINLDTSLSLHLYTITNPILPYPLLKFLEISGDGFLFFPLLLSFLLFPSPTLDTLTTPTSTTVLLLNLLLGGLLDLLLIGLLKHLFRRPRPLYNKNMSVAFAVDHFSFPSGHSSRVFFIATFVLLHSQLIQDPLFSLLNQSGFANNVDFLINNFVAICWTWALVTSISRVLLGRHFVFDVVVGMILGVLEGQFVFWVFNHQNLTALVFR